MAFLENRIVAQKMAKADENLLMAQALVNEAAKLIERINPWDADSAARFRDVSNRLKLTAAVGIGGLVSDRHEANPFTPFVEWSRRNEGPEEIEE